VSTSEHAERFTHLRPLLFTIVYEILGSATESDDVLQDSYLRWADVDLATVRDTKSYLAQLITSQALNALRTRARRREWFERAIYNSAPAVVIYSDGDKLEGVFVFEVIDDVITNLYAMRNPDKLAGIAIPREISRS